MLYFRRWAVLTVIGLLVTFYITEGQTLTDNNAGQTYKTVKIGNQLWLAANLNIPTEGGSWCYENIAYNCSKYGRLYNWETAMSVCPSGWRLPTRQDWQRVVDYAGGNDTGAKTLKAKKYWENDDDNSGNGSDDYGFFALPGGYWNPYTNDDFYNIGYFGYWWTATERDGSLAYYRGMSYDYNYVPDYYGFKQYGFSVRCVRDDTPR